MTLARKIALLGLANVALAGGLLLVFGNLHYGLGAEAFLVGPARDRVLGIANAFQLALARQQDPTAVLARFGQQYDSTVAVSDPDGRVLWGQPMAVPAGVVDRMHERPPGAPPPPPPGSEEDNPRRKKKGMKGPPREPLFLVVTRQPTYYWTVLRIPLELPEGHRPGMLVLRSATLWNSELFFNWRPWLALGAGLLGVTILCWWPFLRRLTRTIAQLDRATAQIALGRFDTRVQDVHRQDELGHLSGQINQMAQRLDDFVRSQKRFLGDTAHELSAPIARVQFALGILEQKVENERSVLALREEVQEMSELVSELLSFSRIGLEPGSTERHPLDLAALVRRAAERENVPATLDIAPGLTALAHERYLLRAVGNLIRNAQRYAGEGIITVRGFQQGGQAVLLVEDEGPGLPPDSLGQIFEPFYRPQSSRSRESGGVGLGLAIVRNCVEASGGTVTCRNRAPRGLEVRIALDLPNTTAGTSSEAPAVA